MQRFTRLELTTYDHGLVHKFAIINCLKLAIGKLPVKVNCDALNFSIYSCEFTVVLQPTSFVQASYRGLWMISSDETTPIVPM